MKLQEVTKQGREELVYNLLLYKLVLFNEKMEKVTLYRKHNNKGRLISQVVCYLTDTAGNVHIEKYKLYDDEYLFLLCAIQQDFPNVDFEDLTADVDKPKIKNEVGVCGEKG